MGYGSLAARWHNIHRTVGLINDNLIVQLNERLDSPLRLAPWNSDLVMPGKLNATFTSIMTHAYSKTKRLTTIIDNKGQKHQLHHSAPRDPKVKEFRLPPQFYAKRKGVKGLDVEKRSEGTESNESGEDNIQDTEEQPQIKNQMEAEAMDTKPDPNIEPGAVDPDNKEHADVSAELNVPAAVQATN